MKEELPLEDIKKLLEQNQLVSTGDAIMTTDGETVLLFVTDIKDEKHKIFISTPTGVPLAPAGDFYDFCQEKAKDFFMKYLKDTLRRVRASQMAGNIGNNN